jgi:hypothetical protein
MACVAFTHGRESLNTMKTRAFQIASVVWTGTLASAGTVLYEQNFNTGPTATGSTYSMSSQVSAITDTSRHFIHTTSTIAGTSYLGVDGGFVSGLNTNFFSSSSSLPTVTTSSFSLDGNSTVQFAIDLALHSSGSRWDSTSHVDFEYSIDGGSWASITSVDTDGADNAIPLFNGSAINRTFTNFATSISGLTGSMMQVRVVWADMDPGDSLGIDNLTISVVPVPPAAFAGLGLLAGLGAYRRFRK